MRKFFLDTIWQQKILSCILSCAKNIFFKFKICLQVLESQSLEVLNETLWHSVPWSWHADIQSYVELDDLRSVFQPN